MSSNGYRLQTVIGNTADKTNFKGKPHLSEMASISTLIWRIICLLCFIIQDRVESASLGGDITVDTNLTLNGSPYVVSQDLVVAENATLAVHPGVQLHFETGVALRVKGSLQAKGNPGERIIFTKSLVNSTYNDGIRLSDGNSSKEGRLEIFLGGHWMPACDNRWDMKNAEVACRQLGFLGAKRYYRHPGKTGYIWLNDVDCQGTEMSLMECKYRTTYYYYCDHDRDIGLECYSLANWKGIEFSSSGKLSSLQYVNVSLAYEAIKVSERPPELDQVTVISSIYGVKSANASSPLTIMDSFVSDNVFVGIQIKDRSKGLMIENTVVSNTINGHGLSYNGDADAVNFCSDEVENMTSFPIYFEALGKLGTTGDCAKTIKARPGQLLTVYYQSMTGEDFELDVRDGNNKNASQLKLVNESTGVNQAITPSLSSGHELYIRFRYRARYWKDVRVKFLITDDRDAPSLVISNCTFRDNHEEGVSLTDFMGNTIIDTTTVIRNGAGGMTAERVSGALAVTNSHFINNSANGLKIVDSSFLSCNLHGLSSKENEGNGSYFHYVASLNSDVFHSAFVGNAHNGIAIANSASQTAFRNVTAILNMYSGVQIHNGQVSSSFESCNLSSNREDGCCITNQAGTQQFFNCTAHSNLRHGVSLSDPHQDSSSAPRHFFKQISLIDNTINDNTQYGFKLAPEGQDASDPANITMVITNNQFMRNSRGGIFMSPENYWWTKPRRVQARVTDNHFEQNKVNAFHVSSCVYLKAVIKSNRFINNTDKVLALMTNSRCGSNKRRGHYPVKVEINGNRFMKNRAENVLFIDFSSFLETVSAIVRNNTFEDNEAATKDLFPNFYRRSTTRAVIVLKEGSFTLRENILENPKFAYQLSTLRADYQHSIDAKFNWWGTAEECKIVDRIFDFQHRVQLSPVEFFPYLLSSNKKGAINLSVSRPSCFLKGATIGGIVDRPLALLSEDSPYEVQDDIIILANGSLSIPKNVTLKFPSRSAMVVQGMLSVHGTEKEKVRFLKKQHQGEFRLSGGAGPWEGRVEFFVNNTWWPLCLPPNSSFTTEAKSICQQLDLYYETHATDSRPGQESGFVHNVVCDGNPTGDTMSCRANTWSYGPTCLGNIVQVSCQHYNWAGLHLTMSNHQSSLEHLEIQDAGYTYRSDIEIPGAALKVDLFHHNISNVFINNSVGIGVQLAYHSLFHNHSLMPHSTISNTKSHGVLSKSPSLSLTDVKLTRNDGSGFVYESYWDKINTFAVEMASADVSKTLDVCSKNKTFLPSNKVFYFTLEALDRSSNLRCQHVMETQPGYKIVLQSLYYSSSYRDSKRHFLHVYDGANASIGSPWMMEALPYVYKQIVQFLFNSTKSRIVFDLNKLAWVPLATNFIAYTVKENEQLRYISGEININRVNISNSLQLGVLIRGNSLKSLCITKTGITNTKDNGISITPWDIDIVKIMSSNLQQNLKGINFPEMTSTELTIENCVINGSVFEGVSIANKGSGAIRIVNSSVTYNGFLGVSIRDRKSLKLLVSGSTFSWNKYGAIYFYRFLMFGVKGDFPVVLFESNYFFRNQRIVVDIRTKGSWVFVNNTFEENRGTSVISFYKFNRFQFTDTWTSPLVVHSNLFLANECPGKAVINIGKTVKRNHVIITNNNFTSNLGRCVFLEGTATFLPAHIPISITDNLFNENYCENNSVLEVLHVDENATLANNIFTRNRAGNVVFLQVTHVIDAAIQGGKVAFNNNTLSNNIAYISSHLSTADDSCAFVLSGIYKGSGFSFNKFNNPIYQRELCIRLPATSWSDVVNVTHNWWGTVIGSEVRKRIFDFDDNYDFAIANDWPFLLNGDDPASITVKQHDFKQHGKVLSGRLFDSITLKASQSPYSVTSDLTVLDNVTLTIEAGVTVKVSPGMSILVVGALKARGTLDKPVTFTIQEPASSNEDSLLPVRLMHGTFPWEGRAEVFHNGSWTPMSASTSMQMRNIAEVVCRQLGYGPPVATVVITDAFSQNASWSQPVEFLCRGNETFLHRCPTKPPVLDSNDIIDVVAKCRGTPWGNLRFVSSKDENVSQSVLTHVQFFHCGNRHGMAVPAVEVVTNVPKLESIVVRNCSSGGLQIYSPGTDVHLKNSTFVDTGGVGISFVQTKRSIFVDSSESSRNQRGIAFEEAGTQNVPRVHFGRVSLCSEKKAVFIKNRVHLYFDIPRPKSTSIGCQKVLTVARGQGLKLTVLYYSGQQRFVIYDSINTTRAIVDDWNHNIGYLVHKELIVPRDTILIQWSGYVNSKIAVLVEAITINDAPCTYELGLCGWQTFANMSINGINVTRKWKITTYVGFSVDDISDYSYYSLKGKWLYIGNDQNPYVGGRAAIISPPITKQSKLCSIVFFYRVGNKDKAGLSLYIQTETFPTVEQRLIWNAKYIGERGWRKAIVELPNDLDEYRLLFEGAYESLQPPPSYPRNHVTIDNLEMRRCSVKGEHRISNSVFSNNIDLAINYSSVADESHRRPAFTIERSKIIDTATHASNVSQKSAISLDIQDNSFTLANNFISGNLLGGIQASLGQSDGTSFPRSLIYGNTFSGNVNGTILVQKRTDIETNFSSVYITDNFFESNLGNGSSIKLSEVQSAIFNNFFYNNTGMHTIQYNFSSRWPKGQKCESNTFYLNKGLDQNDGVTIESNGPMEYHSNNFKNPPNLYEFSTTRQVFSINSYLYGSVRKPDPIDATRNWWGVEGGSSVASRIYAEKDDWKWAAVEYIPFNKLPQGNFFSNGCPVGWLNAKSTCFVFRGGSKTFREAQDYCQYHGGHLASSYIPEDMEFINKAIPGSRPDGKPLVPIWIITEEKMVGGKSDERCTVATLDRVQKVVPCNSLFPFVCTTTARSCYHCEPNTKIDPPVLCDNPAEYVTVNCSHNAPCFTTTVTTSTNKPLYVLGCADTISSDPSAANCSQTEEQVCSDVTARLASDSQLISSCSSVCCTTSKCNGKDLVTTTVPTESVAPSTTASTKDFAIECYECTNPPEVSKGDECGIERLITCPRSYDRCMTMKYIMSVGQSGPVYVEHRSCSNIASCDPKNLLNSCTLMNATGRLTDCSIDCCQGRLCNMPGAQESITKPNNPPKARNTAFAVAANFFTCLLVLLLAMLSMCLA